MTATSFKYNETIFMLGRALLAFNMETLNYSIIPTNLPFSVNQAASVRIGRKAYIFHATDSNANKNASELDLQTHAIAQFGP